MNHVLEEFNSPHTLRVQLFGFNTQALFGQVSSYHFLLALEEAGTTWSICACGGELAAANEKEIEKHRQPVIVYRRV